MDCRCNRPHFAPRRWNLKDGQITFFMDSHGVTDILPGPESPIFREYLKPLPKPYGRESDHIHWAIFDPDQVLKNFRKHLEEHPEHEYKGKDASSLPERSIGRISQNHKKD